MHLREQATLQVGDLTKVDGFVLGPPGPFLPVPNCFPSPTTHAGPWGCRCVTEVYGRSSFSVLIVYILTTRTHGWGLGVGTLNSVQRGVCSFRHWFHPWSPVYTPNHNLSDTPTCPHADLMCCDFSFFQFTRTVFIAMHKVVRAT